LEYPFNISAATEVSDFKFGMQFGFSKAHHKISPRRKSGRGHGLGELPKILGFPLIFLQRLKLATSNLVCSLGLPRPIIKSQTEKKWSWPSARGAPKYWEFPFNISATTEGSDFKIDRLVGFAKAHHKIPFRRKRGRGPGLGELPKIWGSPLNIYAITESIDFKYGTQYGWPTRLIIISHK